MLQLQVVAGRLEAALRYVILFYLLWWKAKVASWKEENVAEEGKDKRGVRAIRKIRHTLF